MLETFTVGTFAPHQDAPFRLHPDAGDPLDLRLVEVTPLGGGTAPAGGRAPFSLVFRGPRAPVLPQRIYLLEHEAIGTIEIFLVPIGPDQEGMRYEAVFT